METHDKIMHHASDEVEKTIKGNKKMMHGTEELSRWFESQTQQLKHQRQQKWDDFRSNLKF